MKSLFKPKFKVKDKKEAIEIMLQNEDNPHHRTLREIAAYALFDIKLSKTPLLCSTTGLLALDELIKSLEGYKVTEIKKSADNVNPDHYKSANGIECIDVLEFMISGAGAEYGLLAGTSLKYIWRLKDKNRPLEDAKKARWYLHRLHKIMGGK